MLDSLILIYCTRKKKRVRSSLCAQSQLLTYYHIMPTYSGFEDGGLSTIAGKGENTGKKNGFFFNLSRQISFFELDLLLICHTF